MKILVTRVRNKDAYYILFSFIHSFRLRFLFMYVVHFVNFILLNEDYDDNDDDDDRTCSSEGMLADRHTDRHAHHNIPLSLLTAE